MERESQPNYVQDVVDRERTPEEQLLYDIFSNEHEEDKRMQEDPTGNNFGYIYDSIDEGDE